MYTGGPGIGGSKNMKTPMAMKTKMTTATCWLFITPINQAKNKTAAFPTPIVKQK